MGFIKCYFKRVVLLMLLFLSSILNAQHYELGTIQDSIPVANSNNETFALYLPKAYNPNELSSLVIIFSPSARGKEGVETFVEAAEAYNYILVCSNNSKNGLMNKNFAVAQRLFNHVFSNFSIDENRFYLAGFSGGSRLATAIATSSNNIAGVIACGAGFSPTPDFIPSTQNFAYVGLCGDRDMNYTEMIDVKGYLNKIQFRNTFFPFDGGHTWPPTVQILMAFDWLEIESLRKGHLKKPDSVIMKSYTKNLKGAKNALENNQPLLATTYYERSIKSYGSFFDLDSVRQELQGLKRSKKYVNALKSSEKAFEKEVNLTPIFLKHFNKDYENAENANLKWWKKEFEKLNKQVTKANREMPKMIERLRFRIFVAIYMKNNSDTLKPTENQKAFSKALFEQLYPEGIK